MPTYTLDTNKISADALLKVLQAGNNTTLTKIDECTVRIDTSGGGGGTSDGTQYHLKLGDDKTVEECIEYLICGTFIIDTGVTFTIDPGGRLAVIDGPILNDGTIVNNGVIKNGAL